MLLIFCVLAALAVLVLFLPVKGTGRRGYVAPDRRFHEADAVLSRRLLKPGTPSYREYYESHPGKKEADDRARQAPGLLNNNARFYHRPTFAAADAAFETTDLLGKLCHGKAAEHVMETDPVKATAFIRRWMLKSGAHSVGFCSLKDYHLYSHKGRGPGAGKEIPHTHFHAIALTVEMDHEMMQAAPAGTTVMESADRYLQSGILAVKLATYLRRMGYEATAHIDGNYELICPLVAVDAGLGTIGRMGLLMTPKLGPRVRIAVVTTNLPLVHDKARPSPSTLHFCELCMKCADNCPAAAIPRGPVQNIDGTDRWQIDSERCYHYWTLSGTDCGRCMKVCPFSHPDTPFHRFIRWAIKNNLVFRHLAVKLDDVFYGRKPAIRPLPFWAEIEKKA